MKIYALLLFVTLELGFFQHSGCAAEAYVSDSFKITLRAVPSNESRIIAMLSSGEPIEILEARENWSFVRYHGSELNPKEGWVLSRFTMDRKPWEGRAKILEEEKATLAEELAALEKKWDKLSREEGELKKNLQSAEETLKKLTVENESLRGSQKVKWFMIGGLVMFAGWLTGFMTGRLQRKRRSSSYSYGR